MATSGYRFLKTSYINFKNSFRTPIFKKVSCKSWLNQICEVKSKYENSSSHILVEFCTPLRATNATAERVKILNKVQVVP